MEKKAGRTVAEVVNFFTGLSKRFKEGPVLAPLDQIAANEIMTRSAGIRQEKTGWRMNFSDDDIVHTFERLSEYGYFKCEGKESVIKSSSNNIASTRVSLESGENIDIFVTRSERRLYVGEEDGGIELKTADALVDYLTVRMAELKGATIEEI